MNEFLDIVEFWLMLITFATGETIQRGFETYTECREWIERPCRPV